MKKSWNWIFVATCIFAISCKKNTSPAPEDSTLAPLSIEFDNIVGGQNLVMGNEVKYENSSDEKFSISLIQYFISNISVKNTDGKEYVIPQDSSYFLIKESEPLTCIANVQAPEGDYSEISFILGVDSLRSTMDISLRTGVLDPAREVENGMYWGWNSGYVFYKMEGLADVAPLDPGSEHKFRYHIGGFGGYNAPTINNIRKITLDLNAGGIARVRSGRGSNVHVMVDLAKMFSGSSTISIADNSTVMFSPFSANVADNLPGMFRHDHTEN